MYVTWRREGAVAVLTLGDGSRANAFDLAGAQEIEAATHRAATDADVSAIVLVGAGSAFCAGADVRALAAAPDRGAYVRSMVGHFHEALRTLRSAPKPVVAAVGGAAAGGGFGLALAADLRLGSPAAFFRASFSRIGLPPDGGLTFALPRLVGLAATQRLLWEDARVDATEAASLGILHRVVPAGGLAGEAVAQATRLASLPREAVAATKALLASSFDNPLTVQLAEERLAISRAAASPAAGAAFERFVEEKKGAAR